MVVNTEGSSSLSVFYLANSCISVEKESRSSSVLFLLLLLFF
uniref:Uncharacterized protein n=1 Tax=Nelumbo nucifera TaxID=4432 RepID=A0A822Y9X4_NELNU|nr:TPA_asm: hypothetical protein HUJ06_029404 [Nelumbo nucifera]